MTNHQSRWNRVNFGAQAVAYPEPVAVEATITDWNVSERHDRDMLTGSTNDYTQTRATVTVTVPATDYANGRVDRYRIENWFDNSLTIWHEHGGGSSSSVGHNGGTTTVEEGVEKVKRHSAEAEDPCHMYATKVFVLGSDLGATAHRQSDYDHERTQCGRPMTSPTRVLRSTVDPEKLCGSCYRGSW